MKLNEGTKDARGRVIEEGDELILNVRGPVYYRVMAIQPNLDPSVPEDMLLVHIGVMIPFMAKRGAINNEFIRVRTCAEAGPTNVQLTDIQLPNQGQDKPAPRPGPKLVDTEGAGE